MTQLYPQDSPLWLDLEKIFGGKEPIPVYTYTGEVHTDTEDIKIDNLVSIDTKRDYVNNIGDEIRIKFQLSYADYIRKFYPKRDNLELTLVRKQLVSDGGAIDESKPELRERFKAIFMPDQNFHANLHTAETVDDHTLNTRPPIDIQLQLLNRTLEPLRIKTFHGVFNDIEREKLIRAVLAGETAKVMIDGKPGIDAMDIVKPDNKEKIKQIIFPHWTSVLSLPTYIQERHTGMYNNGIGSYFQTYRNKRTWFIYPLYDMKRFSEPVYKLIVYAVNGQQFMGMDRTYRIEDKTLHISVTGERQYVDDGETSMMQLGSGFRQTKADDIMDMAFDIPPGKGPVGIRKKINTEAIIRERDDSLNYAPMSSREISNNIFAEASKVAVRNGARIDAVWHNSDPSLLYPGMPCKYVYMTDKDIKEVNGVLLFNQSLATKGSDSKGVRQTDMVYTSNTVMTLFVERFTDSKK